MQQSRQARVPMWLEDHYQAAMAELARRLQGGTHLVRMMPIVVINRRALEYADELAPPVGPREPLQRTSHIREAHTQLQGHGRRACRVLPVVATRLAKVDPA